MISDKCSIEEFVESVKGKSAWDVISLAVEEATSSDRLIYRSGGWEAAQRNSQHLKQVINLFRYETKSKRHNDRVHQLYTQHWGP